MPHQFRHQQARAQLFQHGNEIIGGGRLAGRQVQIVRATRIARRLHAQLAGRVSRQEIALHHAILDDVAADGFHAFFVERRGTDAADHVRIFKDLHVRRQHLRAQGIVQESGLAVQGATRGRLHIGTQQTGRQRRLEQHRTGARAQLARVQARQGAFGGVAADGFRTRHFSGVAHGRIPVVALHLRALAGDGRHGQAVAREWVAADEAARIGGHKVRLLHVHARAFAIRDTRVDGKRGRFGPLGQHDGFLGGNQPGIEQLQVAGGHFQHVRVGQARAIVLGREAGDVVGGVHRGAQGRWREIGGAGIAALLADKHGHAHALVLVLLDRLDLAFSYRHGQAAAFADFDGSVGAARFPRKRQHITGQLLQLLLTMGKYGVVHALFSSESR